MKRLAATYRQKHYYRGQKQLINENIATTSQLSNPQLSIKHLWKNLIKFFFLLVIIYALAVLINQQLIVRSIDCRVLPGNYACPNSLWQKCASLYQQRLLFYPYDKIIAGWHQADLPFKNFFYQKYITGKFKLYFSFNEADYLIIDEKGQSYGFDFNGQFTPIPPLGEIAKIYLHNQQLIPGLADKEIDNVLSQQFSQLASLLKLSPSKVETITLTSPKSLSLKTAKATYLLDLFSLDENLQKLDFIEQSDYTQVNGQAIIDLRLNLPVVQKAIDDTTK